MRKSEEKYLCDFTQLIKNLSDKIVLWIALRRHTTEGNGQKLGIQHAVSEHTIRVEFNHISARYYYRNREDEVNLRQYLAHSLAIECISRLTAVELNEVDTLLDKIAKDVSEVY